MSGSKGPQCSHCNEHAFYRRKYSGEALCTKCFKASIVEKTRKTISKYNLVKYGEKVGIAVSGGKDSMSLLNVMHQLSKSHPCKLYAITVDEGVQGYRDEALFNVKEFASRLNVPLILVSYQELYGFTLDEALSARRDRRRGSTNNINARVGKTGCPTVFLNLFMLYYNHLRWHQGVRGIPGGELI